jgi:hypothetical protein
MSAAATAHRRSTPARTRWSPGTRWSAASSRVRHGSGTTRPTSSTTMGQRWPLPNIIRSTSRFPAQSAAYPLTGRRTCTDHRAAGPLMSVVDKTAFRSFQVLRACSGNAGVTQWREGRPVGCITLSAREVVVRPGTEFAAGFGVELVRIDPYLALRIILVPYGHSRASRRSRSSSPSSQSSITRTARPMLPTWTWFWACSWRVKTRAVTERALVRVLSWSDSWRMGT